MAQTKKNPVPKKKVPERQCMGCRETHEKRELLRIVRTPEGEITIDFTGKKSGRGAYICRKSACLKKARKSGILQKQLSCQISDEIYDELAREIELDEKIANGESPTND